MAHSLTVKRMTDNRKSLGSTPSGPTNPILCGWYKHPACQRSKITKHATIWQCHHCNHINDWPYKMHDNMDLIVCLGIFNTKICIFETIKAKIMGCSSAGRADVC